MKSIPDDFEDGLESDVLAFLNNTSSLPAGSKDEEETLEAEIHPIAEAKVSEFDLSLTQKHEALSPARAQFFSCSLSEILDRAKIENPDDLDPDDLHKVLLVALMYGWWLRGEQQAGHLKLPGDL